MTNDNKQLSRSEVWEYLARDVDQNLAMLGAIEYDTVRGFYGVRRGGELAGLIVVIEQPWTHNDASFTVMVTSDDDGPANLLAQADWPRAAVWSTRQRALLPALEEFTGAAHDPGRGVVYFVAQSVPERLHALVRQLTIDDADTLDLSPCSLSPVALRNWIKRGWRVFWRYRRRRADRSYVGGLPDW